MSHRPRFVFDTSVLVSAAMIEDSKPAEAFRKAREIGEILTSTATAAELNEVLDRDRLRRYISRQNRERFLVAFVRDATLVDTDERIVACRDPKDDKFLELAVGGKATCVVTSDEDLLALHPFRGIPILSVDKFIESLRGA